jgi:hypothetical protein
MLSEFLRDNYGILETEEIQLTSSHKEISISEVSDILQKRGTEEIVMNKIKEYSKANNREEVKAYIEGVIERLVRENVISL